MTIPVECTECGHRDGQLHVDHRVVTHPGNKVCPLPPLVQTPTIKPTRYPSPYRAPKLVGRDRSPSRWFE